MSARMSEEIFTAKSEFIDQLEESFHRKVQQFTKDVKTTMRAVSRQAAIDVFEFALTFLTQAFPDLSNTGESASSEKGDEHIKLLEENFEKLSKRLSDLEAKIQQGFSSRLSNLESKLPSSFRLNDLSDRLNKLEAKVDDNLGLKKVSEKLNDLEMKVQDEICQRLSDVEDKHQKDLSELSETCRSNSQGIMGLRKLHQLLKSKFESLQATTAAAATTSASSQGSALAAASPHRSIQGLRQRSTFSVKANNDAEVPRIVDMKLLPGGFMVLADMFNCCLKVFNTKGEHITSLTLDAAPLRLTVLNLWSSSGWDVAVSLWDKCQVALINVTKTSAVLKNTLPTSKPCWVLAAVDMGTLAVGYLRSFGIDLVDLSGQILRQLSSDVSPNFMEVSPDGHLLITEITQNNKQIVKLKLADGSVIYKHKLQKLQCPRAITFPHQDASCIIADQDTRTLHLISPSGGWVQQLWGHSDGADEQDLLLSVSLLGDRCLCCTYHGHVFVMDVL